MPLDKYLQHVKDGTLPQRLMALHEAIENEHIPKDAQPEIKDALKRYYALSEKAQRDAGPPLYWMLGSGTPWVKWPKDFVGYVDKSPKDDENCLNCDHIWQKPGEDVYICDQLGSKKGYKDEEIRPEAWCKIWAKKVKRD